MSSIFLTNVPFGPPPAIAPGQTATLPQIVTGIQHRAAMGYRALLAIHADWSMQVWSNPHATPDEVLSAMGNQAGQFLRALADIGTLTQTIAQRDGINQPVPPVPRAVTYNPDGTVTLAPAS